MSQLKLSLVSPYYLALFRVCFGLIIMAEVAYVIQRADFFFLGNAMIEVVSTGQQAALWAWLGIAAAFTLGLLTPLSAAANYFFIIEYFRPHAPTSYHADMIYVPTAFLMILLPVSRRISVDAAVLKRFWGIDLSSHRVPRLFHLIVIYWVMGFMYFDSTIYKLESPFWLHGLGFWLPTSYPSFTTFSWNVVLNQQVLSRLAGYITLAFEFLFIFVFWMPRARWPLVTVGILLHLGIAIAFPIPLFGLMMLSLFILFFPVRSATGTLLREDRMRLYILGPLVVLATAIQLSLLVGVPLVSGNAYDFFRDKLGLTRHTVFGQWQFTAMKADIALVYAPPSGVPQWIPWIKENGHVGSEAYGRFWSAWWLASLPGSTNQRSVWAKAAASWLEKNSLPHDGAKVIVKMKELITEHSWEKDRHLMNEQRPWQDIFEITWRDGQPQFKALP